MASSTLEVGHPNVVSHAEWLTARSEFLTKEKEFTRLRDELSRQRRTLPWEKVEKRYEFDSTKGKVTLADLFDGRSQLVIYHFMLGPGWQTGLPKLFVRGRSFRRVDGAPSQSRYHAGGRFPRSAGRNRSFQEAHGLEVSVGFVLRQRF